MASIMADGLSCPVCYEYLNDPKILVCGHTLCKKCLVDMYHVAARQELMCPMCRRTTHVPDGDVSRLPTNITVKGLVEDLQSATYPCTANCEQSDQSMAIYYCRVCEDFMCQSCHDLHGKWKKNADHDVVSVDEVRRGAVRAPHQRQKHCGHEIASTHRMNNQDASYTREEINELQEEAQAKIKALEEYNEHVKKQKQNVRYATFICRYEIEKAHDEAMAKILEKKNALLAFCDKHEQGLLDELDMLSDEGNELLSSLKNAGELMFLTGRAVYTHDQLDKLTHLVKMADPNASDVSDISRRGKMLDFSKRESDFNLGEVHTVEWKVKADVDLEKSESMNGTACMPDGRIAVGGNRGGLKIFSPDGQLTHRVLEDVSIHDVAFLANGACVVRDASFDISLYTRNWTKLNMIFDTLTKEEGGASCLAVDGDDRIYVSFMKANKIQVFTPAGGKPVKEISCDRYGPYQICVLEPSKLLVMRTHANAVRVRDQQGTRWHSLVKDKHAVVYPGACIDGGILVAVFNRGRDRVTIERYTNELKYIKTHVTDHVIKAAERNWYRLQELVSGELVLCTTERLYIFEKTITAAKH